jgi:hypothetical protein
LPYPFYESGSERLVGKTQGTASVIDLENAGEMKCETAASSALESVSRSLIPSVDSGIVGLSAEKVAVSASESITSSYSSLNYSDDYGNGTIFTQALPKDISERMFQEGMEILDTLKKYVSHKQWGTRGHNVLFSKIYFFDENDTQCLPSLDCGLYVSGYESFYNTTDGKVKTVKDMICDGVRTGKDEKKNFKDLKNKTHSIEHLTARIHTLDAFEFRDKRFFPTSLTMRLDDIDDTLVFNREYDYPKIGLKQMKWFLENVLELKFPEYIGSGQEVFSLSSKDKALPSRESEMLFTLLRYKDRLNSIFRALFDSQAIGDFTDLGFLMNSDIIKSSSRFMDSEQVFLRSLASGDEQITFSTHIPYGSDIRKPTKAVIHVLSYNDMCRYCRGTFSWLLASGGLRDAIRTSLFNKMRDEGIAATIVRNYLPEDDIDIRFYCSSLKNPESCC